MKSLDFDIVPQFYDTNNYKIYHQYNNHFAGGGGLSHIKYTLRYKTHQFQKTLKCNGFFWDAENVLFLDLESGYIEYVKFVKSHQRAHLIYVLFLYVHLIQQKKKNVIFHFIQIHLATG